MRSSTHRRRARHTARRPAAGRPGPTETAHPAELVPEVLLDWLELTAVDRHEPDDRRRFEEPPYGGQAHDGGRHGGMLLYVSDPDDGSGQVELGFRPLGAEHPNDLLLGTEAPPEWLALGVRASGRATHLDAPGSSPEPVQVEVAVTRTGRRAGRLHHHDGRILDVAAPEGLVVDTCLRVFGLATPPPEVGSHAFWTARWVDRIATAFNDPQRRAELRTWDAVEALHPAHDRCGEDEGHDEGHDPAVPLEVLARRHAERWHWEAIRTAPELSGLPGRPAGLGLLSWFDDGSLARWLLSLVPPIGEIVDDIGPLLGPTLHRRLQSAVADLMAP
jgi:hypothetical protein